MDEIDLTEHMEELFAVYKGILFNSRTFVKDHTAKFAYDFQCREYRRLSEKYDLAAASGNGSEFERAVRLMSRFAPRLTHDGMYDNHIACNAEALLEYSLDDAEHGINCLNKSKILQECCLALGIFARRVWIYPCSPYDFDNHVVNEVYDLSRKKWVMLDMTAEGYFADENGTPLSVLEIREKFALDLPCEFIKTGETSAYFQDKQEEKLYYKTYFAKNLFRLAAEQENRYGTGKHVLNFLPEAFNDVLWKRMNGAFRARSFYGENDPRAVFDDAPAPRNKSCDTACLAAAPE